MKKHEKKNNASVALGTFIILAVVFLISYSFTGNVIIETSNGDGSYSVLEDVGSLYNITVENTELNSTSNITEVSFEFPDSFSFLLGSEGTNSQSSTFSNTTTKITWNNDGLIMNLTAINFWFNLSAATPGSYDLIVRTVGINNTDSFNIPITVEDITPPSSVEFVSPTESDLSNLTKSNIEVSIEAFDNGAIDTIIVRLFNSDNTEIDSTSSSTSPLSANFTVESSGIYHFNSTVNDTAGNSNSTETRIVNVSLPVDSESPVVTLVDPEDGTSSTASSYGFTFTVDDSSSITSCELVFDGSSVEMLSDVSNSPTENEITYSSISVGNYEWKINCTDAYSNVGSSSLRDLIVSEEVPVGNETTESTTESTTEESTTEETTTEETAGSDIAISATENDIEVFVEEEAEESSGKKYQKEMIENEDLLIDVKNETHTLNVKEITQESVSVVISSTPQEATFLVGEKKKFDVSEDGFYDLVVTLNFIDYSDEDSPRADFTVETINEKIEVEAEIVEEVIKEEPEEEEFDIVWVVIPALVLLIIAAAVWDAINSRKAKKKKKSRK